MGRNPTTGETRERKALLGICVTMAGMTGAGIVVPSTLGMAIAGVVALLGAIYTLEQVNPDKGESKKAC